MLPTVTMDQSHVIKSAPRCCFVDIASNTLEPTRHSPPTIKRFIINTYAAYSSASGGPNFFFAMITMDTVPANANNVRYTLFLYPNSGVVSVMSPISGFNIHGKLTRTSKR